MHDAVHWGVDDAATVEDVDLACMPSTASVAVGDVGNVLGKATEVVHIGVDAPNTAPVGEGDIEGDIGNVSGTPTEVVHTGVDMPDTASVEADLVGTHSPQDAAKATNGRLSARDCFLWIVPHHCKRMHAAEFV